MSRLSKNFKKVAATAISPLGGSFLWSQGSSGPGQAYNPGGPGDIGTYEEVWNRPESSQDPNRGVYAWGDDANRTYQLAYNSFRQMFNRAPTQNEFSQIMGAFQGPNSAINGRAYLANLQQMYQQNPHLDPSNVSKPDDVRNSVNQQFQSILGRAPTQDEAEHFAQAISSGQTDAYGLGSFLKQMPEYTNAQDKQFREGLSSELQGYDEKAFNRMKGDVISAYGANGMAAGLDQNGRSLSPSLDYALTDMMGKIAENRGNYLAQLSASQYGGNKDLAIGNYQNTLNDMYSRNQSQRQNQMNYANQLTGQGFQGADYGQQMRDYMNYQNSQQNRPFNSRDWTQAGLGLAGTGIQAGFSYLGRH